MNKTGATWMSLVEKALAKMYSGYYSLYDDYTTPKLILPNLIGCPVKELHLGAASDQENFIQNLLDWSDEALEMILCVKSHENFPESRKKDFVKKYQ